MLEIEDFGDVRRLHMRSWRSRAAGYGVSAYLVRNVLVDTGFAGVAAELDAWTRNARRSFLHGSTGLMSAVVTHAHEDHSGNAGLLLERGVPVWMSPATRAALERPPAVPVYRRFVWGRPLPVGPDRGRFELPDALEILPAPGHTDDHHVVWDRETGTLFGGDLFLGVRVRVAHHSERPRVLVRTLRALAALEPARLFDAHRGDVPTPAVALRAKADWLEELIAGVTTRVATGQSERRIRDELLGREPAEYYVSFNEYSKLQLVGAIRREE